MAQKIDKELASLHDRLASGFALGNMFGELLCERDVARHRELGLQNCDLSGRLRMGQLFLNSRTNRGDGSFDLREFGLGIAGGTSL